jgi:outer membrane immunogenic protein
MDIKTIFGIAALATLVATPVLAADMPLKAPPMAPAPVMTWTGCYLGLEGGGEWGRERVTAAADGSSVTSISPRGGLFGGTIGCNYQTSNIVFGVEDDLSWSGLRGTASDMLPFNPAFSHSVSTTWLDTLRGRVGIVVNNNALLYVTGGGAFTNIRDTATGPGVSVSNSGSVTGWTFGGGVEVMIAPQWSIKGEYLYVRFPSVSDPFGGVPPVGTFTSVNTRLTDNIVRAGINWHFH